MTSSNPTTLEWPPRYIEQQNTLRLNDGQTTVHMKSPSLGPGLSSDGVLPPIQAECAAGVNDRACGMTVGPAVPHLRIARGATLQRPGWAGAHLLVQ